MIIKKSYRNYLVVLLFFLLAGLFLLVSDIIHKQRTAPATPPAGSARSTEAREEAATGEAETILYFLSQRSSGNGRAVLSEEKRLIPRTGSVTDQARRVLEELGSGSQIGQPPVIPAEAELRHLFLIRDGTLIVSYSQALVDRSPGGIESELACIYAIVNTLTRNFPEIASVRILIEGSERDTLCGHVDLSGSLKQDLSFVVGYEQAPVPVRVEKLPP